MTVFQRPNAISLLATVAVLVALLAPAGPAASVATALAAVLASAWGYDELRYGVNWLRRSFGAGAMVIAAGALIRLLI